MTATNPRTKIGPSQVFTLVQLLPKDLQEKFRKETWEEVKHEITEFTPEPESRYEHSLGLSWLTKHKIPNTVEELEEQRMCVFQTMVSGPDRYNVGQFFVVFPSVVYATRDIEDNLLVIEVMDELEFPPMPDIKVKYNDEIRGATYEDQATVALRYALQSYAAQGRIKIHEAGFRMYANSDQYTFQERYVDEAQEPKSFQDTVRRQRRG